MNSQETASERTPKSRPKKSSRGRIALGVFVAVAVFLLFSMRGIARVITEYWWFDSAGYKATFTTKYITQIKIFSVAFVVFGYLSHLNMKIAERAGLHQRLDADFVSATSPESEAIDLVYLRLGGSWRIVRIGLSLFFAASMAFTAAAQWSTYLLMRNAVNFGQVDPHFGRDIGFFVFRMPFLNSLIAWSFTAILVILVLSVGMHYLCGSIRLTTLTNRVSPLVKAHVSVLLAALALIRAVGYWFDRYNYAVSNGRKFDGISYTDIKAGLPVTNLLILVALSCAVLFIANVWRRGWGLLSVAFVSWALVSVVMGGIYPTVVQRFFVDPDETTKEAPYVSRNIEATKDAFGLSSGDIEQRSFEYHEDLRALDVQKNAANVGAIPLLAPEVTASTFATQQVERTFFRFAPDYVDVDRYVIDGLLTPVVIGARELNLDDVPDSSWESVTLSFTHGNGVALAPSNRVIGQLPDFVIGDVPVENRVESDLPIEQPRIYFGEHMRSYALANTDRAEIDSIEGANRLPYSYTGSGGVNAGSGLKRALFALKFGSIDTFISDFVRPDSVFLWHRNVSERVQQVAPFLSLDHNPYPVIANGRIIWVIDAYTTSDYYPYSNRGLLDDLSPRSGLRHRFNYVRNSVKATVDAYDGTVTLYVSDNTDPVLAAWMNVFPNMFKPFSDIPDELADNLRYPEDLFVVQTNMWNDYHVSSSDTDAFLEGSDRWSIAQDPGGVQGADRDKLAAADGTPLVGAEHRVKPFYQLLELPGEDQAHFAVTRTFVPFSSTDTVKELQAFIYGVSDVGDEDYGRLVVYNVANQSGDSEAPAPALVASQITSQDQISERISLLDAKDEGSSVEFGDLVVLPVEDSLLYVRPLYVIASGTKQPNMEWVIVSHADDVVMCKNLNSSIAALFGSGFSDSEFAAGPEDQECLGDINTEARIAALRDQELGRDGYGLAGLDITRVDGSAVEVALDLLQRADAALAAGELGHYQALVDEAKVVLNDSLLELEETSDSSDTADANGAGTGDAGERNAGEDADAGNGE